MNPQDRYSRFYTFIKPMVKNQAVRDYGPLVFSLLTSAIFAFFAIKPTLSTIVSLQKTLDEQKTTLTQIDQKTNDLTLARKNIQNIPSDTLVNLNTMIPPSSDLPFIIDNLNYLAQVNQATISGLQFQPIELSNPSASVSAKEPLLSQVDFTLNTQGSYENLTKLLNNLGKSARLIDIQSVTFTKPEEGPLLMSITARAYYLK